MLSCDVKVNVKRSGFGYVTTQQGTWEMPEPVESYQRVILEHDALKAKIEANSSQQPSEEDQTRLQWLNERYPSQQHFSASLIPTLRETLSMIGHDRAISGLLEADLGL